MLTKTSKTLGIVIFCIIGFVYNSKGQTNINSEGTDSIMFYNGAAKTMTLTNVGKLRLGDIKNTNISAILQLNSTTGGVLIPRMTTAQRNALAFPVDGILIYNITTNKIEIYSTGAWQNLITSVSIPKWTQTATALYPTDLTKPVGIGTSTPGAKLDVVGRIWQTGVGQSVFLGQGAGAVDDLSNNQNVFVGFNSGAANTSGYWNVAVGHSSLQGNVGGIKNVAYGVSSLAANTSGQSNTATGFGALASSTTGNNNTAQGAYAMYLNTTGGKNLGLSSYSLYSNTLGGSNTAVGYSSMQSNTTGNSNSAIGTGAGFKNTTGSRNVFVGDSAGYDIVGNDNVMLGYGAGIGVAAGNDKLYIGNKTFNALITGDFLTKTVSVAGALTVKGELSLKEQTPPGIVVANYGKFYANSADKKPHFFASDGTDYDLSATGTTVFPVVTSVTSNSGGTYASDDFVFGSPTLAYSSESQRFFFDKSKGSFRAGGGISTEWDNINVGGYSMALGFATTASGYGSFAVSNNATASGQNAIAIGESTTAPSYNEVVVGAYNVTYTPVTTATWSANDRIFSVGNGQTGVTSNAMTILKNGNIGVGTTVPSAKLDVVSDGGTILIPRKSTAGDPTGVNGMIYYNSNTNKFRIFENGAWANWASAVSPWNQGASSVFNNSTDQVIVGNINAPAGYKFEVETPADATRAIAISADQNYTGIAQTFGIISDVSNGGTGLKYGFYSVVTGNAAQTNAIHGIVNQVIPVNTEVSYGIYNNLTGGTGTGTRYGIYNTGENANYFSGKVGVGTINPGAKLDVAGHIWQTSTGRSVFVGEGAGASDDLSFNENTFIGFFSGTSNTTGYFNSAYGKSSLRSNTTGFNNTSVGGNSSFSNTIGNSNSSLGYNALFSNTTGGSNVTIGYTSLYSNVAGSNATVIGTRAMYYANNTATAYTNSNVAVGFEALRGSFTPSANTGNSNTAIGYQALLINTSGNGNTALGYLAGNAFNGGPDNTFIGKNANAQLTGLTNATAIGANAMVGQSNSLILGGTGVNVGIGTSAPTSRLEVVGPAGIPDNILKVRESGQNNRLALTSGSTAAAIGGGVGTRYDILINHTSGNVGIGSAVGVTPNSTLTVGGSFAGKVTVTNANLTLDASMYLIVCSVAGINLNLPSSSSCRGRVYFIKVIPVGGVTLTTAVGEVLDGVASFSTSTASYASVMIMSDGVQWLTIK